MHDASPARLSEGRCRQQPLAAGGSSGAAEAPPPPRTCLNMSCLLLELPLIASALVGPPLGRFELGPAGVLATKGDMATRSSLSKPAPSACWYMLWLSKMPACARAGAPMVRGAGKAGCWVAGLRCRKGDKCGGVSWIKQAAKHVSIAGSRAGRPSHLELHSRGWWRQR